MGWGEQIRAAAKRGPIVIMPTHKSHFDYLVMSYVLTAFNLLVPAVCGGDNLNIPMVGTLLRRCGCFFIRRSFDEDTLYKAIFNDYVGALLKRGYPVEVFIEGGRSRVGKLLKPKSGFVENLTHLVSEGELEDVLLVPIAITYDRVVEGSSFVSEMLGAKKKRESLRALLDSLGFLNANYGGVHIRVADPISVKSYLMDSKIKEMRRLNSSLAHSVLFACNQVMVAPPTAIVATVLLSSHNRGMSVADIVKLTDWVCSEIRSRGGHVVDQFVGGLDQDRNDPPLPTGLVVENALKVLSRLVTRTNDIIFDYRMKASLELGFYRNQILHHFVKEGLVTCALAGLMKELPPNSGVNRADLVDEVKFLSNLLKFEFIYQPAPDITFNFDEAINYLSTKGTLLVEQRDGKEVICVPLHKEGQQHFVFLCTLFWPFIDSYWVVATRLLKLWPSVIMEEEGLLKDSVETAEALYYAGHLDFFEAMSSETIKNALLFFEKSNAISFNVVTQPVKRFNAFRTPGLRLCRLHPEWQNAPKEDFEKLVQQIARFCKLPRLSLDIVAEYNKGKKVGENAARMKSQTVVNSVVSHVNAKL